MTCEQIVVFNPEEFVRIYPEFSKLTSEQLINSFDLATGILNNTNSSPVCDRMKLKRMIYLLTAHISFLNQRGAGNVGAVSSATEGSVSVGYAAVQLKGNAGWYGQSQYGVLFWQMVLPYMSGRYVCQ